MQLKPEHFITLHAATPNSAQNASRLIKDGFPGEITSVSGTEKPYFKIAGHTTAETFRLGSKEFGDAQSLADRVAKHLKNNGIAPLRCPNADAVTYGGFAQRFIIG